jgi:tryptophan aminotransferase
MVSLLAGKPNADTFPFESITLKLKPPSSETLTISGADLDEGLQYGMTAGLPRLVAWLEAFQSQEHGRGRPAEEGWRVSVGVGSQDLLAKVRRRLQPQCPLHALSPDVPRLDRRWRFGPARNARV